MIYKFILNLTAQVKNMSSIVCKRKTTKNLPFDILEEISIEEGKPRRRSREDLHMIYEDYENSNVLETID